MPWRRGTLSALAIAAVGAFEIAASAKELADVVDGGAATGVMWSEQKEVYKTYRPIKVYNPDAA